MENYKNKSPDLKVDGERTSFDDLGGKMSYLSSIERRLLSKKLSGVAAADTAEQSVNIDPGVVRAKSWGKELNNGSAAGACIEMAANQAGQRKNDN